jgi:2-polyprenyl-3-methyl-5-hydroxy-6-metoxy-1,4-benzoquinol methylase
MRIFNFYSLKKNKYYFQNKSKKIFAKKKFILDNYWDINNHIDPDGKKRNLLSERFKKINDLKTEIKFIKKYKKPSRIIDLGSGMGFFLSAFDNKWKKFGVEISKNLNNISGKYATIFNLDLEKKLPNLGKFDVIFTYHVIEHMQKPEMLIYNIKKLAKKDSLIIIGTPNFDSACARRYGKNYRFFYDKTHITFFSDISMFRMLVDNGFQILDVHYPFFETKFFNKKNLLKIFKINKVSPPFYGNLMTFYCTLS